MNDPHGSGGKPNLEFVEYVVKGWPYLFAVAKQDIKTGEELLLDYGEDYWEEEEASKRERMLEMMATWKRAADLVQTQLQRISRR